MDVTYVQAFTNPVWLLAGDQPVRDTAAAEYALRWIDKLQDMADAWPGWRAPKGSARTCSRSSTRPARSTGASRARAPGQRLLGRKDSDGNYVAARKTRQPARRRAAPQ